MVEYEYYIGGFILMDVSVSIFIDEICLEYDTFMEDECWIDQLVDAAPVSLDIRSCLKKAYPLVNVYSLHAMEHHHFIAG